MSTTFSPSSNGLSQFSAPTAASLSEQIRVILASSGPAALADSLRNVLAAAAEVLDQKAQAPEQVHFYRRGDEQHWYKMSAAHMEYIRTLTGERYDYQAFYTAPTTGPAHSELVHPMGEGIGEGDAIARSKFILRLVDAYVERPSAQTRTVLRAALMHQFDRDITPQGLLDIARTTGLRAHLRGVPPSVARELLANFVAAIPAAACGARDVASQAHYPGAPALEAPAP